MSEQKIDILNRDEFINRVIQLVNLISSNKGNMTFAINGSWGCGKTFVLEEIEHRLSDDQTKKYLVIHYNCWQYDYYDEPLVAIVAALIDCLDQRTKLIPKDTKAEAAAILKQACDGLLSIGSKLIEAKIGYNPKELLKTMISTPGAMKKAALAVHDYDGYFRFKGALTELQTWLRKLTDYYTLVFAVDELDRCLPEYTIKVLERLHHITEDMTNALTIIAVDKKRLKNTIESIFGESLQGTTDEKDRAVDDYLKKFIRFEVKLDNGKPDGKDFFLKFQEYYNRFDPDLYGRLNKTEQFIEELFHGIDARTQEQIVEKATIFNDVCFGTEKQDHSMMYMELFLATMHYHCQSSGIFSDKKMVSDSQNVFHHMGKMPSAFKNQDSGFCFSSGVYSDYKGQVLVIDPRDVYRVVFMYWYEVPEPKYDATHSTGLRLRLEKEEPLLMANIEKLRQKIHLLEIIQ